MWQGRDDATCVEQPQPQQGQLLKRHGGACCIWFETQLVATCVLSSSRVNNWLVAHVGSSPQPHSTLGLAMPL